MRTIIVGLTALIVCAATACAEEEEIAYDHKTYGKSCAVMSVVKSAVDLHMLTCDDSSSGPEETLMFICSRKAEWFQSKTDDAVVPNVGFGGFLTLPSVPDKMNLIANEAHPYPMVSIEMRTSSIPAYAFNWGFNPKQLDSPVEQFQFAIVGEASLLPLSYLSEETNGELVLSYRIGDEVGHILLPGDVDEAINDYIARCGKMGRAKEQ